MLMTSRSRTGSTAPITVLDVVVLEAADDVDDGIDLADVRQELVAEPFALARALDQPRDVHELDDRGHRALRLHDPRQGIEPRIGHLHDAGVGLDRGERVVGHERPGGGEGVEEGGLADVGQADDPESQHDDAIPRKGGGRLTG